MSALARPYKVLFVCTGNSARSILAEGLLNDLGRGRFIGYSAGSHPGGTVHPLALEQLAHAHIPAEGFRSKSCDEFVRPGAPVFDFVITVCDNAAGEICPVWSGTPVIAHWGVPDPAAVRGSDAQMRSAFAKTRQVLAHRIRLLTSLPLDKLDRLSLKRKLDQIGTSHGEADSA